MLQDSDFHHSPVMLEECIDALAVVSDGIYVDCTAGGGGHSIHIAERLSSKGRLISLDKDPKALATCEIKRQTLKDKDKWLLVKSDYSQIDSVLRDLGIDKVDGVLADLGVSSYQIDTAERGFSYLKEGPLDMRMDTAQALSAEVVVNEYGVDELVSILHDYGEERYAKRIVEAIDRERRIAPIRTTTKLASIVASAMPAASKREDQHPARRTFQAIRIEVNNELRSVSRLLEVTPSLLNNKGRFAVISFHSLEDRLVKESFKKLETSCVCPREFPVCVCGNRSYGRSITNKPIVASKEEAATNKRSACAKLRIFERNQEQWPRKM
ncbi:MAG TPA: 16S rRNA (cytosine(1402)-N(4))-methyltransferase RsmH [Bacillota bacterium]|nr:16S rRNA (cytosine(1402)-N(4))-methyltransferase RsmH [Bacillota bacterium]